MNKIQRLSPRHLMVHDPAVMTPSKAYVPCTAVTPVVHAPPDLDPSMEVVATDMKTVPDLSQVADSHTWNCDKIYQHLSSVQDWRMRNLRRREHNVFVPRRQSCKVLSQLYTLGCLAAMEILLRCQVSFYSRDRRPRIQGLLQSPRHRHLYQP